MWHGRKICVKVLCCGAVEPWLNTHMWVVVLRAELVQVQQGLVHALLKLQGTFKGLDTTSPLIPLWFLQYKTGQDNSETLINERREVDDPTQKERLLIISKGGLQLNVKWVVFVCLWKISGTAHSHPRYLFVLCCPPNMGHTMAQNKKSHSQCLKLKQMYLIKYELIPWHLAGRSFPPSGSAVSWASQHARAPRVTGDGRTWQSCAMPGHPGQSSTPARRKEGNVSVFKKSHFLWVKQKIPEMWLKHKQANT